MSSIRRITQHWRLRFAPPKWPSATSPLLETIGRHAAPQLVAKVGLSYNVEVEGTWWGSGSTVGAAQRYLPGSRQMPHMSLRDTSGTRAPRLAGCAYLEKCLNVDVYK
jgi:hypothetical protein